MFLQEFLVLLLRLRTRSDNRRPLAEVDLFAWRCAVDFRIDGHPAPSVLQRLLLGHLIMVYLSFRLYPVLIRPSRLAQCLESSMALAATLVEGHKSNA